MVENAITNAQWYDPAGVQYSIPVNGPATGNVNGRVMVNSPLGKSGFSIFTMTNARYNMSTSYIGTGALESSKYYDAENASFNYALFNQDFPDLGASDKFITNKTETMSFTQRLRLTYRNDIVELTLGGRVKLNRGELHFQNAQILNDDGVTTGIVGTENSLSCLFQFVVIYDSIQSQIDFDPELMGIFCQFCYIFKTVACLLSSSKRGAGYIYGIGTAINCCNADVFIFCRS